MSRTMALTRLLGFGFYDDKFKEAEDGLEGQPTPLRRRRRGVGRQFVGTSFYVALLHHPAAKTLDGDFLLRMRDHFENTTETLTSWTNYRPIILN